MLEHWHTRVLFRGERDGELYRYSLEIPLQLFMRKAQKHFTDAIVAALDAPISAARIRRRRVDFWINEKSPTELFAGCAMPVLRSVANALTKDGYKAFLQVDLESSTGTVALIIPVAGRELDAALRFEILENYSVVVSGSTDNEAHSGVRLSLSNMTQDIARKFVLDFVADTVQM